MYQAQQSSSSTPVRRGVQYQRHYPKSFVNAYGTAMQNPTQDDILSRVWEFNCEWVKRPKVGISETCQTLLENQRILENYRGVVFCPEFVDAFIHHLDTARTALRKVNNKDKTVEGTTTESDVLAVLRLINNSSFNKLATDAFNAGGAAFSMGVSAMVPSTLLTNQKQYADKLPQKKSTEEFKADPSPTHLQHYLLENITPPAESVLRHTLATTMWEEVPLTLCS